MMGRLSPVSSNLPLFIESKGASRAGSASPTSGAFGGSSSINGRSLNVFRPEDLAGGLMVSQVGAAAGSFLPAPAHSSKRLQARSQQTAPSHLFTTSSAVLNARNQVLGKPAPQNSSSRKLDFTNLPQPSKRPATTQTGRYSPSLYAKNHNLVSDVIDRQSASDYPRVLEIITKEMEDEEALSTLKMMRGRILIDQKAPFLCELDKKGVLNLLHDVLKANAELYRFRSHSQYEAFEKEIKKIHLIDLGHLTAPQYEKGGLVGFHLAPSDLNYFVVKYKGIQIDSVYMEEPQIVNSSGSYQAVYGASVLSTNVVKTTQKPSGFYPFDFKTLLVCLNSAIDNPFITMNEQVVSQNLVRLIGRFIYNNKSFFSSILVRVKEQGHQIREIKTGYPLVLVEFNLASDDSLHVLDDLKLRLKDGKELPFVQYTKKEREKCLSERVLLERASGLVEPLKEAIASIVLAATKAQSLPSFKNSSSPRKPPVGSNLSTSNRISVNGLVKNEVKNALKAFLIPTKEQPYGGIKCHEDGAGSGRVFVQMSFPCLLGAKMTDLITNQLQTNNKKMPSSLKGFSSGYCKMDHVSFFTTWDSLADGMLKKYENELGIPIR